MAAAQAPTPPQALFDPDTLAQRFDRARRRRAKSGATPFLTSRVIADLSERLQDIQRTFSHACLIGPLDWRDDVLAALPPEKRPTKFDYAETPKGEDYDLVISLLHLQSIDAVSPWMQAVRAMLLPDGLFIACLVGGNSLTELRQALYAVDTDARSAPTPRIHPMIEVRAAAQLLGHIGLAIPVTDSDRFIVSYRALTTLAADLRDVGLTNALAARDRTPMPSLLRALKTQMRQGNEPVSITFELVWMAGWAPHESQQKPLKPGSAKTPLNKALQQIRDQKA
jgi:hypothetical protein